MKYLNVALFSIFLLACGQSTSQKENDSVVHLLSMDQLGALIKDNPELQIVDVRTPEEYEQGAISESKLVDYRATDFKQKIQELEKDKPVLVYCARGGRSAKACAIMKELEFKELYDLDGGYTKWSSQNR